MTTTTTKKTTKKPKAAPSAEEQLAAARAAHAKRAAAIESRINAAAMALADGSSPDLADFTASELDEMSRVLAMIQAERSNAAEADELLEAIPRLVREGVALAEAAAKATEDKAQLEARILELESDRFEASRQVQVARKRLREIRPAVYAALDTGNRRTDEAFANLTEVRNRFSDVLRPGAERDLKDRRDEYRRRGGADADRRLKGIEERLETLASTTPQEARDAIGAAVSAYRVELEDLNVTRAKLGLDPKKEPAAVEAAAAL